MPTSNATLNSLLTITDTYNQEDSLSDPLPPLGIEAISLLTNTAKLKTEQIDDILNCLPLMSAQIALQTLNEFIPYIQALPEYSLDNIEVINFLIPLLKSLQTKKTDNAQVIFDVMRIQIDKMKLDLKIEEEDLQFFLAKLLASPKHVTALLPHINYYEVQGKALITAEDITWICSLLPKSEDPATLLPILDMLIESMSKRFKGPTFSLNGITMTLSGLMLKAPAARKAKEMVMLLLNHPVEEIGKIKPVNKNKWDRMIFLSI